MDIAQYLLLFLPGMVMFTWLSWDFADESWELREALMTTWRPPAYWYKTVIPVSSALLAAAGPRRGHQVLQDAAHRHRLPRSQAAPSELT